MPDPGEFRHLVYLYNPTNVGTSRGDVIPVYDDAEPPANGHAIRMALNPLVGRELVVALGMRADVSLKCRCWFTPLLTALTRVYWYDGYAWKRIEAANPITPDMANREIWFYGCLIPVTLPDLTTVPDGS